MQSDGMLISVGGGGGGVEGMMAAGFLEFPWKF